MADSQPNILLFAGPFQLRGTSAYTLMLMDYLPQSGFAINVICDNAQMIQARPSKQTRQVLIREYRRLNTPVSRHVVRFMMLKDVQRSGSRPDLIHIQSRPVLDHGNWLARKLGCPYVVTVHDYLRDREAFRIDRNRCRKVLAVSESVREDLLRRTGLTNDFVSVIHTGVEIPPQVDVQQILDPGHVPVVGTAGPLEAVKGFPFFLGAAQRVLATGRDVEFLIAGAGPEEFNLRRLARKLGIAGKVTFVPNLFDLTESLRAMDIFCLPSLQQGLGTIMLEPMAMGKPVIATSVGGVYSVVHDNQTGLLVPPSNSAALAERIMQLLNDPARAKAIGQSAREMVQREFGVEKMVNKTVNLYRELLCEVETAARKLPQTTAR